MENEPEKIWAQQRVRDQSSGRTRAVSVVAAFAPNLPRLCEYLIDSTPAGRTQALPQMRKEDFRALTPLIYHHVTPYGTFRLDLIERMPIEETA